MSAVVTGLAAGVTTLAVSLITGPVNSPAGWRDFSFGAVCLAWALYGRFGRTPDV